MKKLLLPAVLLLALVLGAVDYSKYGAGPMLKPAKTYYVSLKGNDKNDGKTLKTAFRSLHKGIGILRAGDTLLIDEGVYYQSEIPINVKEDTLGYAEQCGKPGSPIRIMGLPGKKVTLVGGLSLTPVKRNGQMAEFVSRLEPNYEMVQELPSGIELQKLENEELVKEIPGTYFYDKKSKRLVVHYAALEQTGVSLARHRIGIRIHGSYIHLENLEFRYFYEGIYARMNRPFDKNKASNITIQNCRFFYNYKSGIVLDGASWSLIKNNLGAANTQRGNFMTMPRTSDNLFLGNWSGPTPNTKRQKKLYSINYGINSYGGHPPRNHIIGNYIEGKLSFRWKAGCPGSVVRDNIFKGTWHAESKPVPATITRNVFGSRMSWPGICAYNGWEKDFKDTPIKFYGNVRNEKELKNPDPELLKAKSLKVELPEPKFPEVTFKDLRLVHIGKESAAVLWETPDCDGWGEVILFKKGEKKRKYFLSPIQGSRHAVGLTDLESNTEYEFRAAFKNRRNKKYVTSRKITFKTVSADRAPKVLEVGKGKMTLEEASLAAMPGDTVKLLPGTHYGRFIPLRSGKPGKPITLLGEGKAVIDGLKFYSPAILLPKKEHIIIDGVTFVNADPTSSADVIVANRGSNITVRNCRMIDLDWRAGNFISFSHVPGSLIYNNVIHGGSYPIQLGGKDVKIINNTIVDATMLTLNLWGVDNIEIRNNIFYRPCIPEKRNPSILLTDSGKKIISEGNVFYSPIKEHPMGGRIRDAKIKVVVDAKTLAEWQKLSGLDKTSVCADPLFVDYQKGDFRLKENSPVKGKGASL